MKSTRYLLFIFLITISGCASQSDVILLDERIAILEIEQSKLKEQYFDVKSDTKTREAKEQNLRTQSAGLRVQIETLREEIQILNGKLEEIQYLLQQDKKHSEAAANRLDVQLARLTENTKSNAERLKGIEIYLDIEVMDSKVVSKTVSEGEKQQPQTEDELYKSAKVAFDNGDFETAREKFEDFIKTYPKSKYADNAQYWIGDIYYRSKWYEKAIVEYNKVIENYPTGNKVKDALLKQGYAFYNIGQKSNARTILKELINKYPNSSQAKIAEKKLANIQ